MRFDSLNFGLLSDVLLEARNDKLLQFEWHIFPFADVLNLRMIIAYVDLGCDVVGWRQCQRQVLLGCQCGCLFISIEKPFQI